MFTRLLCEIRVARDEFKKNMRAIYKEKEDKIAVVKRDYRAGSETEIAELAKIENVYSEKTERERKEASNYIFEFFESVVDYETEKVKRINSTEFNSVEKLSNLPMTSSELKVINDAFGKNKNYWVEKILIDIARKNAISDSELELESDYETKMQIVSELQEEFEKMLSEYDGSDTVSNAMILHDTRLTKMELKYKNGLNNIDMKYENVALHAYTALCSSPNFIQKHTVASNVLNSNADERVKNEFMYLLAKNGNDDFASTIETYVSFKENNMNDYEKAKNAVAKIKHGEEIKNALNGLENNEFVKTMLEDEKNDYKSIRNYLETEN